MSDLYIDIETYCELDLLEVGLYKYVEHPSFKILLFAYNYNQGEATQIIDLENGDIIPKHILMDLNSTFVTKHAFNATFEYYCIGKYITTFIEQWKCTMLHSLYCGHPASLQATCDALGMSSDMGKLRTGKALIKTFCTPNRNGNRITASQEPEKWELFKQYCIRDVDAEMEVEKRLAAFPVPPQEQKWWVLDQRINNRGIKIDSFLVNAAMTIDSVSKEELTTEIKQLTGLDNPNSPKQLGGWLGVSSLAKSSITTELDNCTDSNIRRVLELRQELGKTSTTKYQAMFDTMGGQNRIRGLLQFYGANRTGRWAGRLVQVQNLPRNYLSTLDIARKAVLDSDYNLLKLIYGNIPDTLSQLIRTAFIPSEGNVLAVADFSAIEARIIAWLSGETWRNEVFATHGKIYEASASEMFGVPIEKIKKGNPEYELRQKGKIAELALGYGGGVKALETMGALQMGIAQGELQGLVNAWRSANPAIVELWSKIERAALGAFNSDVGINFKNLEFRREYDPIEGMDFLTIRLPSGRKLFYASPHIKLNRWGKEGLCYYGMNQTTKKWESQDTYGGKLVENIIQAIARDCLAVSIERLESEGHKIVMHIHDEVVIDMKKDLQVFVSILNLMGREIEWADKLILKADGFMTEFYKKD